MLAFALAMLSHACADSQISRIFSFVRAVAQVQSGRTYLAGASFIFMPGPYRTDLTSVLSTIDFNGADTDGDGTLTKSELKAALSNTFGRTPQQAEVDEAWSLLDSDGDGKVTLDEWRKFTLEADTLSGSVRGFLSAMLRVVPRTPAVRCFAPKQKKSEPTPFSVSGFKAKLSLIFYSSVAGMTLFATHGQAERLLGTQQHQQAGSSYNVAAHFGGGFIGGLLHACVLAPASSGGLRLGLRRLPITALRDALGFGAFFVAFHAAGMQLEYAENQWQTEAASFRDPNALEGIIGGDNSGGTSSSSSSGGGGSSSSGGGSSSSSSNSSSGGSSDGGGGGGSSSGSGGASSSTSGCDPDHQLGSAAHLRSVGRATLAGAFAGGAYHFASFPFVRSIELAEEECAAAKPPPSSSYYLQSARKHGARALYRGVLRTAASGVAIGAVTFSIYDATMRAAQTLFEERLEKRRLPPSWP